MRQVIAWVADVLRDPTTAAQPHFHRGPHGLPAACDDARCRAPRLDVAAG